MHRELAWDAAGQPRLSSSVLFSDAYQLMREFHDDGDGSSSTTSTSHWVYRFIDRDTAFALPAPLDGAELYSYLAYSPGTPMMGRTSARFLELWQRTAPRVDVPMDEGQQPLTSNITTTLTGLLFVGSAAEIREVMDGRLQLPLNVMLDEAELTDPRGVWQLGSDWVTTVSATVAMYNTLHHQTRAFADAPSDATWYTPQAASSLNTSRPVHNFVLQRHSQRSMSHSSQVVSASYSRWWLQAMTGGRRGDEFFHDLVMFDTPGCLLPIDPSFWEALGPGMRLVPGQSYGGNSLEGAISLFQSADVYCDDGYRFEPPSLDSVRTVDCMANGMWMDLHAQTIRRCVPARLSCRLPLQDLGEHYCQPLLPMISSISASYHADNGATIAITGPDTVTLIDVPVMPGVTLSILGNAFFRPVQVRVGEFPCGEPALLLASTGQAARVSYNYTSVQAAQPLLVTGEWGNVITCTLPEMAGSNMAVTLSSGIIGEQVEVTTRQAERAATLSSVSPALTRVEADGFDCRQEAEQPLALYDCVNDRSFPVQVCAASTSIGYTRTPAVKAQLRANGLSYPLQCNAMWSGEGEPLLAERCTQCILFPLSNSATLSLYASNSDLASRQSATVVFHPCAAGTRLDYAAVLTVNATSICQACPPGSSTANLASATECTACAPGYYSNATGSAVCTACWPGSFAAQPNSTLCIACPVNTFSNSSARSFCEGCEVDQYLIPATALEVGIAGRCVDCPDDAICMANGTILAAAGAYLLLDQAAATVSTTACSWHACVDAASCLASSPPFPSTQWQSPPLPPVLTRSGLPVVNCCGGGRMAAFTANAPAYSGVEALELSGGHNVLCAVCLQGYSQINGSCQPCSSVDVALLLAVLLLSWLLVYCVHRLPHDWSGSATLLVSSNFLQLSALYLATESLPHLASLLNVTLSNSFAGVCIAPMDDAQRISLQLISPVIAFGLLGCVALVQWSMSAAIRRAAAAQSGLQDPLQRLFRLMFVTSSPSIHVHRRALNAFGLSAALLSGAEVEHTDVHQSGLTLQPLEPAKAASDSVDPASSDAMAYQRSVVRLLLLSYTGLSAVVLQCLHWQPVGKFGQRLLHYPTLSPESAAYRSFQPTVLLVLVLVVCGMPVLLAVYLLLEHRRGSIAQVRDTLGQRHQQQQQEEDSSLIHGVGLDAVHSLRQPLSSRRAALLLQLTAMYRPQCWWMPSFVLLRRATLVALLVSLRDGWVWTWLTLANSLLLSLHLIVQPYHRTRDNQLESVALLSLSLQTTLLSAYPPPRLTPGLLAAMNALVLIPLLPLLLHMLGRCITRAQALVRGVSGEDAEHGGRRSTVSGATNSSEDDAALD